MKKFTTFLIMALTTCALVLSMANVKVNAADAVMGSNTEDSPYYSKYQNTAHGSSRVDDTTVNIIGTGGWGYRGGFVDTYNAEDITFKADVKNIETGGILMLLMGEEEQGYNGAGANITMDILRQSTDNHNYLVTYATGAHNVSMEGFTSTVQSFHNDYSGIVVEATDDIITISIKKTADTVTISVNEVSVQIPTALDSFTNPKAVYVSSGLITGAVTSYNLSVVDAERAAYYSATGDYGKNKALIDQYTTALTADLTIEANVEAAKTLRDSIDLSKIKSYDLPRLQPQKNTNDGILAAAIEELGKVDLTPLCTDTLKTYRLDKANDVVIAVDTLEQAITSIEVGSTTLAAGDYSYNSEQKVLTINGIALGDLTKNDYEIKITTAGGFCKVNLTVYTGEEFVPTSAISAISYQLGNSNDLEINFDGKGSAITEVTVGGNPTSNYTTTSTAVVLQNNYLETLAAGEYPVVIKTVEGSVTVTLNVIAKPAVEDRVPVIGAYGSDTDWWSRWQTGSHGIVRTGITEYKVITTSGWGHRGGFLNTFDITTLEASFDLSTLVNDTVMMILFSTADNTYAGEGPTQLVIEFVKISSTSFFVVFSNTPNESQHCVSMDGFTDGSTSDKPGYTGITVDAENGVMNLSLLRNSDQSVTITVNGESYTVANAFATVSNPNATYISIGTFIGTGASPIQEYKINYLYDATLKNYYSSTGTFGIAIEKTAELVEAVKDLSTNELLLAAIAINNQINVSGLRAFDYNFIKDDYEKAKAILDNAISANPDVLKDVVLNAFGAAESAITSLDAIEDISYANDLLTDAKNKLDEYTISSAEDTQTIGDCTTKYNELIATLTGKVKTLVTAQYDEYVEAVANVTDVASMVNAINLRDNLVTAYIDMFETAEWAALELKASNASIALAAATSYTNEDWAIANGNPIIVKDNTFEIVHLTGDIVYSKEKLDATNFTIKLDISSISGNTGSWFSLGLMEQQERFIVAEDASVQDNKGILFLITKITETQAAAQLYIITMTSAGFLTSKLGASITIDITKEVTFSFKTEQRSIQGVSASYFVVTVDGTEVNQLINAQTVKLALGTESTGYLCLASSGATISSPNAYAVREINGYKPTAASLVAEKVLTPPTTTDTQKEYQLGGTGSVSWTINTYSKNIVSVKVGNNTLTTSNYSFNNNKLELRNGYLETLSAGTYTVTLETEDGSVDVELVITAAAEDEPKSGCGCGTGAVMAMLSACMAVATLGVVILKRRNN